jgi:hypothetical protein
MFKIFQSKEKQSLDIAVAKKPIHKYSKEIEQVHHEFEIASELLYEEAVQTLTNNRINNVDKIDRLRNLGFCAVKEVVEIAEKEEKTKLSQQTIELIQEYKRKYPLNKFITLEQVETICGKYGLAYGGIARFQGFVPDKNLTDIEQFAKKYEFKTVIISKRSDMSNSMIVSASEIQITKPGEKNERHGGSSGYGYIDLIFDDGSTLELQQSVNDWNGINFYGSKTNNPNLVHLDFIYLSLMSLHIAAPQKDFNMQGMTVKQFKIVKEVPDPVVLQPVNGGFLIVTAWGDEASDPIIMNELHN